MYRCGCKEVYNYYMDFFLHIFYLCLLLLYVFYLSLYTPIVLYICSFFAALSLLFVNFLLCFFVLLYIRKMEKIQLHRRNKYGNKLMKKVKSPQGKTFFYPRLIYCYCSIIDSLKKMLEKPGFIEKCEKWRDRTIQEGVFCDIYDGRIWNEFMIVDGVPFLSVPFNLHYNSM